MHFEWQSYNRYDVELNVHPESGDKLKLIVLPSYIKCKPFLFFIKTRVLHDIRSALHPINHRWSMNKKQDIKYSDCEETYNEHDHQILQNPNSPSESWKEQQKPAPDNISVIKFQSKWAVGCNSKLSEIIRKWSKNIFQPPQSITWMSTKCQSSWRSSRDKNSRSQWRMQFHKMFYICWINYKTESPDTQGKPSKLIWQKIRKFAQKQFEVLWEKHIRQQILPKIALKSAWLRKRNAYLLMWSLIFVCKSTHERNADLGGDHVCSGRLTNPKNFFRRFLYILCNIHCCRNINHLLSLLPIKNHFSSLWPFWSVTLT